MTAGKGRSDPVTHDTYGETLMSKGGNNREQRAHIREAAREGKSAGEAGVSTGAQRQLGHGDPGQEKAEMHAEKGKS